MKDDQGNDWFLTVTNFDKAEALTTVRADRLSIGVSQNVRTRRPAGAYAVSRPLLCISTRIWSVTLNGFRTFPACA